MNSFVSFDFMCTVTCVNRTAAMVTQAIEATFLSGHKPTILQLPSALKAFSLALDACNIK